MDTANKNGPNYNYADFFPNKTLHIIGNNDNNISLTQALMQEQSGPGE